MLFKTETQYFFLTLVTIPNYLAASEFAVNINHNENNNTNPRIASKRQIIATPLMAHHFRSANNITVLHEVHNDEPPVVLNTNEVLQLKPLKNAKQFALYEKTLIADYENSHPLKEYELHPMTFDFNLGDLEDLEHEVALKSGSAVAAPVEEGVDVPTNVLRGKEGVSYTELPELLDDGLVGGEGGGGDEKKGQHKLKVVGVTAEGTTAAPVVVTRKTLNPTTSGTKVMGKIPTVIGTTTYMMMRRAPSAEKTTTRVETTLTTQPSAIITKIISQSSTATTNPSAAAAETTHTTHATHITNASHTLPLTNAPPTPLYHSIATASPHIFKVIKNKSKSKTRELFKKDSAASAALAFNSVSRYFVYSGDGGEDMADGVGKNISAESANMFQLLINLYDHFFWQPSEIRNKVTTACGIELQAYLTALNGNYEWAQRAYDASGHYRGQALYGNDKWLGEKAFCYELNRQIKPEERKHFEFQFYMALISIRIWLPIKLDLTLQLGECLPKTCSQQDIQAILSLDPNAEMLRALFASNLTTATKINIRLVRKVPGDFNYWLELKFQIFVSFMSTLLALVIVSTWYQAKLNRQKCTIATPLVKAISAKVSDALRRRTTGATTGSGERYNGKMFELNQISTLNDNNNVDIEADLTGTSSNRNRNHNRSHHDNDSSRTYNNKTDIKTIESQNSDGDSDGGGGGGAGNCSNGNITDTGCGGNCGGKSTTEVKELKTQRTNFKAETCCSAGAMTTYEVKQKLGIHQQLLLCFAFQTNARVILNMDNTKETQTSCVHGMRVLSVLWTIMVHTYLQMFTIGENRFTRIMVERSLWYQFVGNATFSVDTFFFISGFLVTFLFLKQNKKLPEASGKFIRRSILDTTMILIYRYIRLTPTYLFVIFLNDFFLRHTFDSSVFHPTVALDTCSLYWWRNIFYINNFYPLSEICMIWSWYMANDMQFYIMASVLLIISTRYFKTALLVISSLLFSSWAVSGIISLRHNYAHKVANPFESFDFLYDKPWQRVGTYIMGMITGYILYKVKNPPKVERRTNLLLWSASLGLLFLIIFGVWEGQLNVINTAFYVSIGHTAFGFALIWIVLSCCWGLAKPVNGILAYRGLWPLSRLTYCTYLIHPVFMLLTSYRMEGTVHLNNLFVLTIFLGNAVVSFGVAFFISVLFEAPVIRLLKICFRK